MAKGQESWAHFETKDYIPQIINKKIKFLGGTEAITDLDHKMFQELRAYLKRSKIDCTIRYYPSSLESALEFLQGPSEDILETINLILEKYQHQLE